MALLNLTHSNRSLHVVHTLSKLLIHIFYLVYVDMKHKLPLIFRHAGLQHFCATIKLKFQVMGSSICRSTEREKVNVRMICQSTLKYDLSSLPLPFFSLSLSLSHWVSINFTGGLTQRVTRGVITSSHINSLWPPHPFKLRLLRNDWS